MKKKIAIASGVFGVLVLLLLVVPSFINWNQYKLQAEKQIKIQTGWDLNIEGPLNMALLPKPHFNVQDVTIKIPDQKEKSASEIASFDKLSINVSVVALLQGKVEVENIVLNKPVISLRILPNGKMNALTQELEEKIGKDKDLSPSNSSDFSKNQSISQANGSSSLLQNISINKIIIDNGKFVLFDAKKKSKTVINNINTEIKAESLFGPYNAKGNLEFLNQEIEFRADTQKYSLDSKSLVTKVFSKIPSKNAEISYTGIITLEEGLELQGETALKASLQAITPHLSFGKSSNTMLSSEGILTFNKESLNYQDITAKIDDLELNANFSYDLINKNIKTDIAAAKAFNLDGFLKDNGIQFAKNTQAGSSSKKQKESQNKVSKTLLGFMPKTLSLPEDLELSFSLSLPALIYNQKNYKNVSLAAGKKKGIFPIALNIKEGPGKLALSAETILAYKNASVSAVDRQDVFSDPELQIKLNATTNNLPFLMQCLVPEHKATAMNVFETWQNAKANIVLSANENTINLQNSQIELDKNIIKFSGSYNGLNEPNPNKHTAQISLNIDTLDWDTIEKQLHQNTKNKSKTISEGANTPSQDVNLSALSFLPHWKANITIDKALYKKSNYEDIALDVVHKNSVLELNTLSLRTQNNLAMNLKGKIHNIKTLEDIALKIDANVPSLKPFIARSNQSKPSILENLKKININADIKGSQKELNIQGQVKAQGGVMSINAFVADPLQGSPLLKQSDIVLKHSNTNDAVQAFMPNFQRKNTLNKALNISSSILYNDNKYSISHLKGDVAGAQIKGDFVFDVSKKKPFLSGDIYVGNMLLGNQGAPKQNFQNQPIKSKQLKKSKSNAIRWSRENIDTSWMQNINWNINAHVEKLGIDSWVLEKMRSNIVLQDGALSLSKFQAMLFDGTLEATGEIKSHADLKKPLLIEGNIIIQNTNLSNFSRALPTQNLVTAQGIANSSINFSMAGLSSSALITSLQGQGGITGSNIILEGLDLNKFARALSSEAKPFDTVQGLWSGTTQSGSTSFSSLEGEFDIKEGVVFMNKMDLIGPESDIKTTGAINLPLWSLKTKHTIDVKSPKDIEPFDISIEGPLDNPTQTFGQGVLENYFARKINRKLEKILIDKLGLPSSQQNTKPAQGEMQQENSDKASNSAPYNASSEQPVEKTLEAEDVIRSVLDGFLR